MDYIIGWVVGIIGGLGFGIGLGLKLSRKWLIEMLHDEGLLSDEEVKEFKRRG